VGADVRVERGIVPSSPMTKATEAADRHTCYGINRQNGKAHGKRRRGRVGLREDYGRR